MTVSELFKHLRKMGKRGDMVSASPNFELKGHLVPLKGFVVQQYTSLHESFYHAGEQKWFEQKVYEPDEAGMLTCVELRFYGPETTGPATKKVLQKLKKLDRDLPVIADSPDPYLQRSLVDLQKVHRKRLKPEAREFRDGFDHNRYEALIYTHVEVPPYQDCILLEF